MIVGMIVVNKLGDIVDDIIGTIEWILAGCPKPVKIPVKDKEGKDGRKK